MLLSLALMSAPLAAEIAAPLKVDPGALDTIGFTRIVLRDEDAFTLAVAPETWRQVVLEELRAAGYPALGGENLLFDQDRSAEARYLLGGEISEGFCESAEANAPERHRCEVEVTWQLLDRRAGEVVEIWATRGTWMSADLKQAVEYAFLGAVHGLLAEHGLPAALVKRPDPLLDAPKWADTLTLQGCARDPLKLPNGLDEAMNATLLVRSGDAIGAGVLISPDGFVLTAAHVLQDGAPQVQTRAGFSLPAELVRADAAQDLALLAVGGAGFPCLETREAPVTVGQSLWAVGSPGGEALAFSASAGIVSGLRAWEDVQFIQTDASLNAGNSGGPLLDEEGRVMGIVSWKIAAPGFEGLSFGVPASVVQERLGLVLGEASDPRPEGGWSPTPKQPTRLPPLLPSGPTKAVYPDRELEFPDGTPVMDPETSVWDVFNRRTWIGLGTAVSGGLLVGGTWAYYRTDPRVDVVTWQSMQFFNAVGWIGLIGGSGLTAHGIVFDEFALSPRGLVVSGRF
ncbi:MAG: trypsin-like peptidase domain-containing protein [Alphaproteobacteria bacterium]|nr:trypsin-like peptidase domain-containing protein [Alphaproteobacteria bacterium]